MSEPTRADALALLHEWNESPSLRKHGLLVEAGVRGYAADDGMDPATVERWGTAGLLHDLDSERHPDPQTHGAIGADGAAERASESFGQQFAGCGARRLCRRERGRREQARRNEPR